MFTGIITDMGEVVSIDKQGDWKIRIRTKFDTAPVPIGASIACSGVCLTVVEKGADDFLVQVSQETLDKTVIGQWDVGTRINLEQSLKLGDELGGHLVFGHVDGLGEVVSIKQIMDSHEVIVALPENLKHLAAAKGSIALDGTSLTVNDVKDNQIFLNIIPHTWDVTSFGKIKVGQKLHVEADMLARYAARPMNDIHSRNQRVEMNKAWETSFLRRALICIITYIVAGTVIRMSGHDDWYIAACVPVLGYILSTVSLPIVKKKYIACLMAKKGI
jgi:riboflavin synthase